MTIYFYPSSTIVELAAEPRKLAFRYSELCGMSADTGYAVRSAIPTGFNFLRSENRESKTYKPITVSQKIETLVWV